jgi:small-conductance mechanosensitive channel
VKETHRAYERARERVLVAQVAMSSAFEEHRQRPGAPADDEPADVTEARRQLHEASEALRATEADVADELDAAWQRNRQAVTDARQAVMAALREQARTEVESGNAARARSLTFPVLNEDERRRVLDARASTAEAKQRHDEAIARFKEGVTAEQLEGG